MYWGGGGVKSEQVVKWRGGELKVSKYCSHWQVFGSKVRVDSTAKVAELELAEKVRIKKRKVLEQGIYLLYLHYHSLLYPHPLQEKMKDKVEMILKHNINCFINRCVCE